MSDAKRLIYAIGDIHGRLDLLLAAANLIETHLDGRHGRIICLGDYVDRGPDSRGVVAFLMEAQDQGAITCLKGNHEDLMVNAHSGSSRHMDIWLGNGGIQTLQSYGWTGGALADAEIPPEHFKWMRDLPLMSRDDHRVYVHAGVMPGFPADENEPETCMWIRERFLRAGPADLPCHIVHGHTPEWDGKPDIERPELLPHRTNLDTGAYFTGILTVGVFDPELAGGPVETLRVTVDPDVQRAA